MTVYADNGATTPVSETALAAAMPYFSADFGNPASKHRPGLNAALAVENSRQVIAKCFHCRPDEIIFTSGGTESDVMAIRSAAKAGAKAGKMHIVSTTIEHHAVLHTLDQLRGEGFEITLVPTDYMGFVYPEAVENAIRPDTCLVSVMYANNEIGSIEDISNIGKVCREHQVLFHTDAVQAAGHIPIDVKADNIDYLAASPHKFHGTKGVGILYAKKGAPLHPLIPGGSQERGVRAGTLNVPAIVAASVALKESLSIDPYHQRKMRDDLILQLLQIPSATLNGSISDRLPGNVNISFGVDSESLLLQMDKRGVYASAGSACTAGGIQASHVLKAIGCTDEQATSAIRFTIGEDITQEEVDYVAKAVSESVALLKRFGGICDG